MSRNSARTSAFRIRHSAFARGSSMQTTIQRHMAACAFGAALVLAYVPWTTAPVGAQSAAPMAAGTKQPLSHDAYDAWWSIQGTTLSRSGEWLAYALTSQGLDGQLVVRNLRTGQELRHPRGTSPTFTPDGKFVVFTIAQTKAEEEKERVA